MSITSKANETQIGGDHYKRAGANGGEEHWDRVLRLGLDYFQGNITKYVERCWLKNGIQDLMKARHYIDKYIEISSAAGRMGVDEAKRKAMLDALRSTIDGLKDDLREFEKKHAVATIMQHQSNAYYSFEGIKENRVNYRCRLCREFITIELDDRPENNHDHTRCTIRGEEQCAGEEASRAYVAQGTD